MSNQEVAACLENIFTCTLWTEYLLTSRTFVRNFFWWSCVTCSCIEETKRDLKRKRVVVLYQLPIESLRVRAGSLSKSINPFLQ